jgi:hypothetical protein
MPEPHIDDARTALKRAGWFTIEWAGDSRWYIIGHNGENVIDADGTTRAAAWHRAAESARLLGMLRFRPDQRTNRCMYRRPSGPIE